MQPRLPLRKLLLLLQLLLLLRLLGPLHPLWLHLRRLLLQLLLRPLLLRPQSLLLRLVRRLLNAGAKVDAKAKNGDTPLGLAKKGTTLAHSQIVARLLEESKSSRRGGRRRKSVAAKPAR